MFKMVPFKSRSKHWPICLKVVWEQSTPVASFVDKNCRLDLEEMDKWIFSHYGQEVQCRTDIFFFHPKPENQSCWRMYVYLKSEDIAFEFRMRWC